MSDSVSQLIEKFRLTEKCVHCQRYFNIYNYFCSNLSTDSEPVTTLSLPLILACGHNACENCVLVDGKKGKCDSCKDEEIGNEKSWNNPCDLYLIDKYKQFINGTLNDSEKTQFNSNCFEGIDKTLEDAQIAIKGGLLAISFKCKNRCSNEVLSSYIPTIVKIDELLEVREKNIDVDTMVKKLELSKAIFDDEIKLKESLNADLSAWKQALPTKFIKQSIVKFRDFTYEQKLDTIVNMIKNGREVVVGRRFADKIRWAPVSVQESNVYMSTFSKDIKPKDAAVRLQYNWLQPAEFTDFTYIEVALNQSFIELLKIPNSNPHKFKLIIKARGLLKDVRVDKDQTDESLTSFYSHAFVGLNGVKIIGRTADFSDKYFKLFLDTSFEDMDAKRTNTEFKKSFFYVLEGCFEEIKTVIFTDNFHSPNEFKTVFLAKVVSGIKNLTNICELVSVFDSIALKKHKRAHARISDCGLVLTRHDYISQEGDRMGTISSDDS